MFFNLFFFSISFILQYFSPQSVISTLRKELSQTVITSYNLFHEKQMSVVRVHDKGEYAFISNVSELIELERTKMKHKPLKRVH